MANTQNIAAAKETYQGFIRLIKVATPIIALITMLVVYLLTR
ncbi:aa3-type cytochrome c oxidase subunit IV [Novosphingobium umbonatum]|jgi:hypothetical protein|nr:aa3-type cytochrome c oxidase subunit IV [Novosphingobium umbonatum]